MKLYAKLLLGFGSLWLLLLVATVMAMYALRRHGGVLETGMQVGFNSVVSCDRMKTSLEEINRMTLSAVWTKENLPADAIRTEWEDFRSGQEVESQNITLPGERQLTDKLFELAAKYQRAVATFDTAGQGERAALYQRTLLPLYLSARGAAQDVINLNRTDLLAVEAQLRENVEQVRRLQIAFVIAGAGLAVICVLILAKTILGPLRALTESAGQIERGNLDLTVTVKSRDELGELARAFNSMAEKLREYRRLDHARLLRTQQTTQLAIDSLPDAVAVFNPNGMVEISNEQARVHFGLAPGVQQQSARLGWLSHLFTEALAAGHPIDPVGYESAVQLFDHGQERFLLPRAVPMLGEKGQAIGVVMILVDVTRLHRADELKSGLLATVSHELKTPLAATRFSVHLLAQERIDPLSEQQRRLVSAACEGADRLNRIIENLLQFHRIQEGQYRLQQVPLSTDALVAQVVDPLRPEFENAGLEIVTAVAEGLPAVLVDPDLIGYVLSNLLTNTLKFVPRGGCVEVSAAGDAEGVRFVVSDNGPGIAEEHLPNLFRRFYRAGASRADSGGRDWGWRLRSNSWKHTAGGFRRVAARQEAWRFRSRCERQEQSRSSLWTRDRQTVRRRFNRSTPPAESTPSDAGSGTATTLSPDGTFPATV